MSDVFVSYARQDAPAERALVEALRGAGIGVLDGREVAAGDDLADTIPGRIEEAACVLVLWSRAAAHHSAHGGCRVNNSLERTASRRRRAPAAAAAARAPSSPAS